MNSKFQWVRQCWFWVSKMGRRLILLLSFFAYFITVSADSQGAEPSAAATIAEAGAVGAVLFFVVSCSVFWYRESMSQKKHQTPSPPHMAQLKSFSLTELNAATDCFSHENLIGKDWIGKVYKGRLTDDLLVAVKRINEELTHGGEIWYQTEVQMIGRAIHRNLLCLHGYCMTPTERILVYPYMANGNVASCLRERKESQPPLDWTKRKRIALDSAAALAYLHEHCDPKIIHRDVKAANIYLDEEFNAVLGDFGLAKVMDYKDEEVTTAVRGTIGHIAPEYLSTGKCSEKTDVFAYGIMLLELITGKPAFDLARLANEEDVMLLDWVRQLLEDNRLESVVDVELQGNCDVKEVEELIQVAILCTQSSAVERPKMSEVVFMLEGGGSADRWEVYIRRGRDMVTLGHTGGMSEFCPTPDQLSGPR